MTAERELSLSADQLIVPAPAGSLVAAIPCPNSYYSYPKLISIEKIPEEVLRVLNELWTASVHMGRDVKFYRFNDVFIVKEGLVFLKNCKLIENTKTYHNDQDIVDASLSVNRSLTKDNFATVSKAILAKSRGSSNFGHFVIEMLPRAWMTKRHLNLADWPVIVDSVSESTRNISEQALVMAGFSSDQVISLGPEPVFVKELIVVDGLTSHTRYISPFVMQALDTIASNVAARTSSKIYVPRRPAVRRDFEDEPRIAKYLATMGFTEMPTAEMTFVDQVAAFKGAEDVVAVSGAALTNIAFCRPGTRITNFMPSSALEVLFWMIGESRRLDYREIRCQEVGPHTGGLSWDRKIRVSTADIGRLL